LYDSENRQVAFCTQDPGGCVNQSGPGRTLYVYDGDGRRVQKSEPAGTTTYVYDAQGNLAAEYSTETGTSQTLYLTADQLGTTRVVTTGTPGASSVVARRDYLPFGEQIVPSGNDPRVNVAGYGQPEGVTLQFTGMERDGASGESGLDYFGARYFSSPQGRFMGADEPGADQWPVNPQSWNQYGYVRGSPLRFVDPTGRCSVKEGDTSATDDPGEPCVGEGGTSITVGGGDVSPVEVGWEWLTGTGPRQRTFTEDDSFTQLLRQHSHIHDVEAAIGRQLGQCRVPTPQSLQEDGTNSNYSLAGLGGVPKYVADYSALATGGLTGNLAVTYLGSYELSFNVGSINLSAGTAAVDFHVSNTSTIASGTRPPVIGYTSAWQSTVGKALDAMSVTGPMSPTQQDFFWTETLSFNGARCRQ
jgi:RHS repeat-associated protein